MANKQIEAYRQIAENLSEIDRLIKECNELAAEANIVFTYPSDIVDNIITEEKPINWQASEIC